MGEPSEVGEGYRRASPWPLFVALGLVLAEGGVLFGSAPVGVGGLLLLATSAVGVARESGYAATPWWPALGFAAVYAALGAPLVALTTATERGLYLLGAAGVVAVAAVGLWLVGTGRL